LALSTLTLQEKGQISMLHIDHKTYSLGGDLDVVVDHALSIDGVEVALFFKEEMPQRQRVSLRSRGKVDVNLVARTFGGGGHQRASGCTIEGALEYAQNKLMAEVVKHLG
jgi:phosphoesterase RecJ-like protein